MIVAAFLFADWTLTSIGTSAQRLNQLWGFRLALLAAVFGGARILYHALDGLLSGRIGADLALTIACLAAIVLGEHQTAGLVVLISLVGESLEGYTVDRARWAVRQSFALQPEVAHLTSLDGLERDVSIDELKVGDTVVVRPGERVPADGSVVAGRTSVDQSAFTGESMPVDKAVGDRVYAGTLNQSGAVTVVTEAIGDVTALARIAVLVGEAQSKKADLERMADRLAKWFLPAVLTVALLTLLGWKIGTGSWSRGVLPALGVLVVACPCPLILATPCAVMASLAWLARRGVIVRGSHSLERLARVDTFAFDKTGTLTQGTLALDEITTTSSLSEEDVLRLAAIAERHSEHLLARLIVSAADERGLSIPAPEEFEALPGAGVISSIRQADEIVTVVVGNRRALDYGEIEFSDEVASLMKEKEKAGHSPLVVAVDGQVVGLLTVRETMRNESSTVMQQLRDAGISQFALLTGDRFQAADAIAKSLAMFDHVATEQLPADKAAWIEASRRDGRCVAMVGDGTNDAPALAAADVGLVLGRAGADLAADAGDILLLGDPLRPLPGLLRLSRALVQNIWQSIVLFAFGLNGIGVFACSFGFLSPVGAALFHEVASLAVMANAMRLLWFESDSESKLIQFSRNFVLAADWISTAVSPSNWVFWLIERWQITVKLLAASVLSGWFLSGLVVVNNSEQVLVTRFGRYEATLSAGPHWRWPWPMEQLLREPTVRVRSVGIGFRAGDSSMKPGETLTRASLESKMRMVVKAGSFKSESPLLESEIIEWTSSHGDRDSEAMDAESLLLTADEVPVDLTAELQYRIRDLKSFAFYGTAKPNDVLRAIAEGVLRDLAASASLDDLLTNHRAELERRSFELIKKRADGYSLGVEVTAIQWLDVHPPKAVVPAYRQVADAIEDRELLVNEADAYADRTLLGAVGEETLRFLKRSSKHKSGASMPPQSDVPDLEANERARADWELAPEIWSELLRQRPDGTTLLSGTASSILNDAHVSAEKRRASAGATGSRFSHLLSEHQRSPKLTSLKLYWDAVTESLSQRSLTVVDPKAAGRQQFWLAEPPASQFPAPFPANEPPVTKPAE